ENAKEVLETQKDFAASPAPRARGWFDLFLRPAFALPALSLLVLVVAYQSTIVIPHLKTSLAEATAPQAIPAFSLIAENSRWEIRGRNHALLNKPLSIYLDIP